MLNSTLSVVAPTENPGSWTSGLPLIWPATPPGSSSSAPEAPVIWTPAPAPRGTKSLVPMVRLVWSKPIVTTFRPPVVVDCSNQKCAVRFWRKMVRLTGAAAVPASTRKYGPAGSVVAWTPVTSKVGSIAPAVVLKATVTEPVKVRYWLSAALGVTVAVSEPATPALVSSTVPVAIVAVRKVVVPLPSASDRLATVR